MLVLISADSLLTVYIGVELLSLSLYAMVAFDRDSGIAAESAMKYFVLGAIASGTLLYGMSMIYGMTGTLKLDELARRRARGRRASLGLIFGLVFIIVGVAFKFGAVPFHMWVPDVYHGAPTRVTLFIGYRAEDRVVRARVPPARRRAWARGRRAGRTCSSRSRCCRWWSATWSRSRRRNLKRMLAYSTISQRRLHPARHSSPAPPRAISASLYYTLVYVIMALGSFGVILLLAAQGFEADELDDFKGLNRATRCSPA